jgi:hypothetical protein
VLARAALAAVRPHIGARARGLHFGHPNAPQGPLPEDFSRLYRDCGLRSCLAVAIGPRAAPLGALLLARAEPHAFDGAW